MVAETLNLSLLRGYRTGGTVHVVINNQVGFTTAPEHSRSSEYCTDVAKMIQAPIFHVNGDDPEAAVWVARLAVEYRQAFGKDVVIDMVCYRRRGHNEGDDPSMTNPLMYQIIDGKRQRPEDLHRGADRSRRPVAARTPRRPCGTTTPSWSGCSTRSANWSGHRWRRRRRSRPSSRSRTKVETKVVGGHHAPDRRRPGRASRRLHPAPPGQDGAGPPGRDVPRAAGSTGPSASCWPSARSRWTAGWSGSRGQDTRRGTFVQRHAALIDQNTGAEYIPLQHLSDDQDKFLVYDSALTEYAALGFEYGYSVANRDALVLWEAQFGDFVNGAQSVIDEYLSSGEAKWGQQSGVVLLLPHGHEGQGPDHTSGRIERFLQLCAEGSMTVAVPSTPGQLLPPAAPSRARRCAPPDGGLHAEVDAAQQGCRLAGGGLHLGQVPVGDLRPHRRPGIGAAPGADLRQDLLRTGRLPDRRTPSPTRRSSGSSRSTRCRVASSDTSSTAYPQVTDIRWVQEEPANQGAWTFLALALPEIAAAAHRHASGCHAGPWRLHRPGRAKVHEVEQAAVIAGGVRRLIRVLRAAVRACRRRPMWHRVGRPAGGCEARDDCPAPDQLRRAGAHPAHHHSA